MTKKQREYKEGLKADLKDYIEARQTELDNIISYPIGTGSDDYSLPSSDQLDEMIILDQQIGDAQDFLDELEDDEDDPFLTDFLKI